MNSVNLFDYLKIFEVDSIGENNKLVNLRGTNGSGKSSVPFSFIHNDPDTFELTYEYNRKPRVIATVCPNEKWLFLGSYKNKCGGLDCYKTQEQTADALKMVWKLPYNILMEGVISSTIFSTYAELFKSVNQNNERDVVIATLLPGLQTCLDRVQKRNGGKAVKTEQIASKYAIMERNLKKFQNAGFNCLVLDNSNIELEETREWFLSNLGIKYEEVTKHNNEEEICSSEALYLPKKEDIQQYEWYKYYKQPNSSVRVNWKNMRLYWYWIAERMNIWYNRVVLEKPAPWTDDKILREGKFTNVIRDLDKGTIVYLNEILKKIDEPCEDLVQRKKEVILNTMIYRLFIRKETWDCIGFITLDEWDEKWEEAKQKLRARRADGKEIFHSAYYVYGLMPASPSPDNHDKTENAINLIESFWKPELDTIYENTQKMNMPELLDYLTTLCCTGRFTAYEWICDWAMCHRHTKNIIVPWTDDSYVNVGPGNKKGLDFIFESRGNLSYEQCDFYLRATWKHYMTEYGFYDRFIQQLPEWMNGDINLRVIEHDACEVQKYLNVYYGTGKLKNNFIQSSDCHSLQL